jgi:dephospho-CoA kinase
MALNKKIIGITGGIGSGKSVVAKILISMGYPVYNSDTEAKELINSNPELIFQIKQEFGNNIYTEDGLDSKKMAYIVFNNPEKLAKLNSLTHPAVGKDFENWVNKQKTNLVFKEAAILFETGIYKSLEGIVLVTAPVKTRVKRVMQRDSVTALEVKNRMKNQWSDERKLTLSDFVIDNSDGVKVIPQVIKMIEEIL